ncbi:MAG: glycosyltransferase family 39 protein [Chloroflexota bacterium]
MASAPGRFYGVAWLGLGLGLLFYLFLYLHFAYRLLRFPFDFDQGEGYDVNSAWALVQGLPIYGSPDDYPFYSSNYPPLFTLVLAPFVALLGPRLSLGRGLSLLATAVVVALIVLAVRRATGSWRPALVAGLLFLASPYVVHTTALARVNALTLALSLGGVLACERAVDKSGAAGRWTLAGGALLLAALFTKPLALDALAAGLFYVFLHDRRRGLALGGGVLGLGGLLYLASDALTSGGFTLNLVRANANPFSIVQAATYYGNFLGVHLLVAGSAAAVVGLVLRRQGPGALPAYGWYFLAALALALGTGKWGAGESYFLPAIASASILCGLALHRLETTRAVGRPALGLAFALAIFCQLWLFWHGPWQWPQWGLFDRGMQASVLGRAPTAADTAAGWHVVKEWVLPTGSDMLSEESTFLLVAGRRVLGNATQQRNLWQAGWHDPAALVGMLERRELDVVILNAQQYPAPVLSAIGRNYYPLESVVMNGYRYVLYVPGGR